MVKSIVCGACAVAAIGVCLFVTAMWPTSEPGTTVAAHDAEAKPAVEFNKDGELMRPSGYRRWVFVGSPVTPHDMNNGKAAFPEFHNVYIDPESYEHYIKTGEFRDGTVMIKELVSVGGKKASSGNGYFQGEFIGLEASVKSAKHSPNKPGNWGFYSFTAEKGQPLAKSAKAHAAASCNTCHSTAAQDYVFTEYYPVLRDAKGKGKHPDQ